MSGKKLTLILAFAALLIYAIWRGIKSRASIVQNDNTAAILNQKAYEAEAVPYGSGTQPSFPSPDTLAPEDPGAPGNQPTFFGGSIPATQ